MEHVLLSSVDDSDLLQEFFSSRDHEVVPLEESDLPEGDKVRARIRGLDFVVYDAPGRGEVEEFLPAGIFPQAAEESIEDALWRRGLPFTRLHALLDFGTGVMDGRVSEDVFWDPTQMESVFNEPVPRFVKRANGKELELPGWSPLRGEALEENREREARFLNLTSFLRLMFACARQGRGPAVVQTRRGWRFKFFRNYRLLLDPSTWQDFPVRTEVERHPGRGATAWVRPDPVPFVQALWAYVWWRRRVWLEKQTRDADVRVHGPACLLEAKPVWLSEPHLAALRSAFRRLLEELRLSPDALNIREERKVSSNLQRLQARLAYLEDLEERSLRRLHYLQRAGQLTSSKVQAAVEHLDRLAAEKDRLQSELEFVVLREAREFYGKDFLGYELLGVEHAPEELEELRAEVEALAA